MFYNRQKLSFKLDMKLSKEEFVAIIAFLLRLIKSN